MGTFTKAFGNNAQHGALLNQSVAYKTVLAAMPIKPSTADQIIQNRMMKKLSDGGFIADAEYIYIPASTLSGYLKNWANPGTFDLTKNGNIVFREYLGAQSSGGYLGTGFNPLRNASKITKDNMCQIIGVGTATPNTDAETGVYSAVGKSVIGASYNGNLLLSSNSITPVVIPSSSPLMAHYANLRNNSTTFTFYKNITANTYGRTADSLPDGEMYVCARNDSGTTRSSLRFVRYSALLRNMTESRYFEFKAIMEEYLTSYHSNLNSPIDYISKGYPATKALLTLATYDGVDMTIHPSVVDTGIEGWNGYRYWMCNTPLPNPAPAGVSSDYENPSLWASSDGDTWVVPAGVTNPVIPKPSGTFNADVDIYYEGGTMYMVYKQQPDLWFSKSTNAASWSTPIKIKSKDSDANEVRSPAILKGIDNKYYIYYCPSGSGKHVRRISADSPDGAWSVPQEINIVGYGNNTEDWHLDVFTHNGYYYLIAGYSEVYVYKSIDGVNFVGSVQPVLNNYEFLGNTESYYRSSIALINGQPTVYYGAFVLISSVASRRTFKMNIDLL